MGTTSFTTHFTTHGRALCLLRLRAFEEFGFLGIKMQKLKNLGYKKLERPVNNGFGLGTNVSKRGCLMPQTSSR